MKIKFRNVDTGEIVEIDGDDFEAFDECMSHKNYQLIFDESFRLFMQLAYNRIRTSKT